MTRCALSFLLLIWTVRAEEAATWSAPAVPGVAVEQHVGERLPLEDSFHDETGARVRLAGFFEREPVVLIFGYARCPQLCSVVANGAVEALRHVSASAGRDFRVVYVSIDPTDMPRELAALKRRDVARYGRTGAASGWHYVASDATTIRRLTDAAGFAFTFDPRQKLYAHPSGFIIATADGRIARYFLGVDFDPKEIASTLQRAAAGKTGAPVFNLLLACARGLGVSGRFGALIWAGLMVAVIATIVALASGIGWMLRDERRERTTGLRVRPGGRAP